MQLRFFHVFVNLLLKNATSFSRFKCFIHISVSILSQILSRFRASLMRPQKNHRPTIFRWIISIDFRNFLSDLKNLFLAVSPLVYLRQHQYDHSM